MTNVEQRFRAAINSYEQQRAECLGQVVRWVYSTKDIWDIDPERADLLHPESVLPGPRGAEHAWGYNAASQLVVINDYDFTIKNMVRIPLDRVIVEYFLRYEGNELQMSRFLRGRLQMLWIATLDQGRVMALDQYRDDGGAYLERYIWEGKVLKSSLVLDAREKPIIETVYDGPREKWPLYRIRRDGSRRLMNQPLPEGMTVKSLLETVQRRLLAVIPEVVSAAQITEPVYCLVLAYDGEGNDVLPPCLGLGLESQRQQWVRAHGKKAKDFIWNPAEFTHYEKEYTQLNDDELEEACDYLNQALDEKGSQIPAMKLVKNVVAELARMDWKSKLKTTPDFVVYAVDFELGALQRNLKASATPDQLQAWKKAGYL